MKHALFLFLALFLLGGCKTPSPTPPTVVTDKDVIGYIVNISPYIMHTHFKYGEAEYQKQYPDPWDLQKTVLDKLQNAFANRGVHFVNLAEYNISSSDLHNLIEFTDDPKNEFWEPRWLIKPEKQQTYNRLRQLHINYVLSIYDASVMYQERVGFAGGRIESLIIFPLIIMIGDMLGSDYNTSGYGLVSRTNLFRTEYCNADNFYVEGYLLQPLFSFNEQYKSHYINPIRLHRIKFDDTLKPPKNLKQLSKDDLKNLLYAEITQHLDFMINTSVEILTTTRPAESPWMIY